MSLKINSPQIYNCTLCAPGYLKCYLKHGGGWGCSQLGVSVRHSFQRNLPLIRLDIGYMDCYLCYAGCFQIDVVEALRFYCEL